MAAFKNFLLLLTLLLAIQLEASKIVYKKPLYGNGNIVKEKRLRSKGLKQEANTVSSTTMSSTTSTTEEDWPTAVEFVIVTTPKGELETNSESISNGSSTETSLLEVTFSGSSEGSTKAGESSTVNPTISTTSSSSLVNTIPAPILSGSSGPSVSSSAVLAPQDNQPVPCTCGVFLSSQIPNGLPTKPLIHQELDRMFPCNAIGRKQCQTKCLEAIVQHLPNSANIVCSALGHDCHKERAYLFIKNCHNQWVNTNLQAGREYCCRSGVPYRCPLMG
ncbi:follicle cell protein 3C-1 isoform X2 [Drosophila takahashii]|uniref:follicle cell protein 3C-1 isoform X2 n=1 Tax=Drosophila takahashii TaxID=29030 RepID=UPI001CF87FDC|nr:follicle cell protein 3C-1 [Drosophila takahashii]